MSKIDESLDFLDSERKILWKEILGLKEFVQIEVQNIKEEVLKRTPDYEKEASQSSKKTSEYRNRSEAAYNSISQYLVETEAKLNVIISTYEQVLSLRNSISLQHVESQTNNQKTYEIFVEIEKRSRDLNDKITEIDEIFEDYDELIENNNKLESIYTNANETSTKIEQLYKNLINRKKEIDELYYDIIGYTDIDVESKEVTEIEGKKHELENVYIEIKENLTKFEDEIQIYKTNTIKECDKFYEVKQEEFNLLLKNWINEHDSIATKIANLLPNALTAGLSHAYSGKREAEILDCAKITKTFRWAIGGMILDLLRQIKSINFASRISLFTTIEPSIENRSIRVNDRS